MATGHRSFSFALGIWGAAAASGCVGRIDESGVARGGDISTPALTPEGSAADRGGASPVATVPPTSSASSAPAGMPERCAPVPPPRALRRLSNAEYNSTVQDLLSTKATPAGAFLPEDQLIGYRNTAAVLTVPVALADQYAEAAAQLTAEATKNVQGLASCPAGAQESTCAATFVRSFGKRAYRRPLSEGEVQAFVKLYDGERARSTYAGGIGMIVETMLQSPHFLYKSELGALVAGERRLTPYETAVQISYLVSGSMPDAELFAAADAGKLSADADVEFHLRRLSKTPRARLWLGGFLLQWMGVTEAPAVAKDAKVFPTFDNDLRAALGKESQTFVDAVLANHDGSLQTLLDAPWSFANARLARHYGLPAGTAGTEWKKVQLPPAERAGILTQPAFLASHAKPNESFPIVRGKFIRERLLCKPLAPPPANVNISLPAVDPKLTTRERFAQHSSVQPCAGCHRFIDALGFGLESYDGIGAFRTTENGKTIDASGEFIDAGDLDGPFVGGVEMASKLSRSTMVRDCAARQAFRWALGRVENASEECVVSQLGKQLGAASLDVRELLVAIGRTEQFARRAPN